MKRPHPTLSRFMIKMINRSIRAAIKREPGLTKTIMTWSVAGFDVKLEVVKQ